MSKNYLDNKYINKNIDINIDLRCETPHASRDHDLPVIEKKPKTIPCPYNNSKCSKATLWKRKCLKCQM